MMPRARFFLLCLALASLCGPASIAEPARTDLLAEVRRAGHDGSEWLVYDIESDDRQFVCCHRITRGAVQVGTCRPESGHGSWTTSRHRSATELSHVLRLYLAVENGEVERVRTYSPGCAVELSRPQRRLADVGQEQSLDVLRALVLDADTGERREGGVLAAVAMHRSAGAARVLAGLTRPDLDADVREQALFWLAQTGDASAERVIFHSLRTDPSGDVREHAVFALSQLPDGRAVDALLEAMRTYDDGEVQRQALFWLAESDDPRALELIAELLDS